MMQYGSCNVAGFKLDGKVAYTRREEYPGYMELAVYPNPEVYAVEGETHTIVFRPGWPFNQDKLILLVSHRFVCFVE